MLGVIKAVKRGASANEALQQVGGVDEAGFEALSSIAQILIRRYRYVSHVGNLSLFVSFFTSLLLMERIWSPALSAAVAIVLSGIICTVVMAILAHALGIQDLRAATLIIAEARRPEGIPLLIDAAVLGDGTVMTRARSGLADVLHDVSVSTLSLSDHQRRALARLLQLSGDSKAT